MKRCPCGYAGDATRVCSCAEGDIHRYRSRLSGPLLDRIDLHLSLSPVPLRQLSSNGTAESSASVRQRVEVARERQRARYASQPRIGCNAQASGRSMLRMLTSDARDLLDSAAESLGFSARAYNRVAKVARTIADLAHADSIAVPHVAEALRYRPQLAK